MMFGRKKKEVDDTSSIPDEMDWKKLSRLVSSSRLLAENQDVDLSELDILNNSQGDNDDDDIFNINDPELLASLAELEEENAMEDENDDRNDHHSHHDDISPPLALDEANQLADLMMDTGIGNHEILGDVRKQANKGKDRNGTTTTSSQEEEERKQELERELISNLLMEYKRTTLTLRNQGQKSQAKALLPYIRQLRSMSEHTETGLSVDITTAPQSVKNIMNTEEFQSLYIEEEVEIVDEMDDEQQPGPPTGRLKRQISKAQQNHQQRRQARIEKKEERKQRHNQRQKDEMETKEGEEGEKIEEKENNIIQQQISDPSISSISSQPHNPQLQIQYNRIMEKMKVQILELGSEAKLLSGLKKKAQAGEATRMCRLAMKHRELLIHSQKNGWSVPDYHLEKRVLTSELFFSDIKDDTINLLISRVEKIPPPSASGASVYVMWSVDYPNESSPQTGQTDIIPESRPPYVFNKEFPIHIQRNRGLARRFRHNVKIHFEVFVKRSFLKDISLGKGQFNLKELVEKSEVEAIVKLKSNDRQSAGSLSFRVRSRVPLGGGRDVRERIVQHIVIDHLPASAKVDEEKASLPSPSIVVEAPLLVHQPSAPPSDVVDDMKDPHRVDNLFGNDVLEAEISDLEVEMKTATGERKLAIEEKRNLCKMSLNLLVSQVQAGELELDTYLDQLRKKITQDQQLAISLKRANRMDDAKRVLMRVRIMRAEVKGAEEAS